MNHLTRIKRNLLCLILALAAVTAPAAAEVRAAEQDTAVYSETYEMREENDNRESAYPTLDEYAKSEKTLSRAELVDLARMEAQKQVEQTIAENEEREKKEQEAERANSYNARAVKVSVQPAEGFLLGIENPDTGYTGAVVSLSDYDRYVLEHLVMGEAGNQGFTGAALVAQSIRDRLVYDGYPSVESVRTGCGYYGSLGYEPNADVLAAVSYIFDQGGSAVQHTVRFFYAYTWSTSSWHETMNHIVTYGDHKFFDTW